MKSPSIPGLLLSRCGFANRFALASLIAGTVSSLILSLGTSLAEVSAAPYAAARQLSSQEIQQAQRSPVSPVIHDNAPIDTVSSTSPYTRQELVRRALTNRPRLTPVESPTWQNRYTLGPGDTLNLSMYDRPDLARQGVPIAPDGTISYLQAIGIQARGKTIPELRKSIEDALVTYGHKLAKVILTPGVIGSKRYTIIGRVREPGSFLLNRPTTILEAIANAQGIEVGTVNGSAFELADLDHSFVARGGRKLDVDLASLYQKGDIRQNALLQPDDYIYVASSLRNEIYVLGEVNSPGRLKITTNHLTVTQAVLQAGSFTKEAFKHNILLIRGSIHHPQTQMVSVLDVLSGKAPDVEVQNCDILYVSKRPFQIVEKALDSAIFTFVQTVTAEAINDAYITIPADVRD